MHDFIVSYFQEPVPEKNVQTEENVPSSAMGSSVTVLPSSMERYVKQVW